MSKTSMQQSSGEEEKEEEKIAILVYVISDDNTERRCRYKRYAISLVRISFFWVVAVL
jgi:hypothetical protein